jgi:hypothetical protein
MSSNTNINLIGLDFETLKTNLKNYLKNNTAFKDYNFEGSNMSVLIDLLSYNTYLNSFYTNMVASEMFLDTAQLRDSIVSHAKELNYLPRSYTSARATVNISILPSTSVSSVLIPRGTSFTSRVGSSTFSFTTAENIVINTADNDSFYRANDVFLYEGSYVTDTFVFNGDQSNQRFVLSNPTIDISSVTVTVVEDSGSSIIPYSRATSLFGVTNKSPVYFIQPAENQQYELVFGDDVFGRSPKNNAALIVEYRISSGELPNGASTFVSDGAIDGHTNVKVVTIESAASGSVAESIESVRYNAPRAVATQERAVTVNDYKTLLRVQFPEIQAINAYGGEDQDPPQYGKVFISVDIQGADGIPDKNKAVYYDFIKTKTPLTITPVFVNPDFTYIQVNTLVRYNVNVTQKTPEEIRINVQAAINDYNTMFINDFESTLRYSQLCKAIDNADTSIVSNETTIKAIKILAAPNLDFGTTANYTINFDIPLSTEYYVTGSRFSSLAEHTFESSPFLYNGKTCYIKDSTGILNIVTELGDSTVVVKQIGRIDYDTGVATITSFNPQSAPGGLIKFYAVTRNKDIFCRKNVLLSIAEQDITINVERVRE